MHNLGFSTWVRACLCLALLGLTLSATARELFRYKDENGNLVLSHTIPNDMVTRGYDIVDEYGNLHKTVDPQLSDEAYAEKLRLEKMINTCEKTLDRVRKLYQVRADIDYAEQTSLKAIDQSIDNIRANLSVMTTQRQEFETEAAQLDIAGQIIPNSLLDNIDRAKIQEKNLENEVENRFGDKLDLRKMHEFDRLVFALKTCDAGLPSRENVTVR